MNNAHILTPQNEVHEIEHSLGYPTFELCILHLSHADVHQETPHTSRHVHFGNTTDESSKY